MNLFNALGTAGGFKSKGLKVGDVVIASSVEVPLARRCFVLLMTFCFAEP